MPTLGHVSWAGLGSQLTHDALVANGTLTNQGGPANQQLLVVCVHDTLWTMQYAAPAELAIETKASPIT